MKKKFIWVIFIISVLFLFCFSFYKLNQNRNNNKKVIVLFNWGEYIDPSIINEYNQQSNEFIIKQSFFSSNELAINKIKSGNQYDIAILSEYAIEQLKEHNLEEIDWSQLQQKSLSYNSSFKDFIEKKIDNENTKISKYTIPYFWGNLGLLYNTNRISLNELINNKWVNLIKNPKFRVALYNNAFEGIFIGLKATNGNIGVNSEEEIQKAKDWLIDLKKQNINLSFITDQLLDRMRIKDNEYYDIAVSYSGDARFLMKQNPNLGYYSFNDDHDDKESKNKGTNIWFDGIVLPKNSNKKGAYDFIKFILQEDNRKKNNEFIGYDSPYDVDVEEQKDERRLTINLKKEDKIYKYNETYKKQISEAWNQVYAYPDPKDKNLIILIFIILFLFVLIYIFFRQ